MLSLENIRFQRDVQGPRKRSNRPGDVTSPPGTSHEPFVSEYGSADKPQ